METKKKRIINILSILLTITLFGAIFWKYLYVMMIGLFWTGLKSISLLATFKNMVILALILTNIYIVFKYIKLLLEMCSKRKIRASLLLLAIAVFICVFVIYIVNYANSYLKLLLLNIGIVIDIIVIPIVYLVISIFNVYNKNKVHKILLISYASILLILVYGSGISIIPECLNGAKDILQDDNIRTNLFKSDEEQKEEYITKHSKEMFVTYMNIQEKRGYLTKDEITTGIFQAVNSYETVNIKYNNMIINNREENWQEKLKKEIEGDYFKVSYECDENYNVKTIIIEKITGSNYSSNNEKNSNIKFDENSTIDNTLITNIRNDNATEESNYFVFENKLNVNSKDNNGELSEFKMCLVYNQNSKNFELVGGNTKNYDKIESYKVYSSGVEITLKNNVKLQKKYYTMRINRYDSKFNIIHTSDYYYIFEPVVTELTDSNGRIVLEMKFDQQSYILRQLKNIEIIFGSM